MTSASLAGWAGVAGGDGWAGRAQCGAQGSRATAGLVQLFRGARQRYHTEQSEYSRKTHRFPWLGPEPCPPGDAAQPLTTPTVMPLRNQYSLGRFRVARRNVELTMASIR